jgi:hypothetical protein
MEFLNFKDYTNFLQMFVSVANSVQPAAQPPHLSPYP